MCYIACSCKQYNTSERKLQDFASGDFGGEENQALVKRSEIGSHPDTAETGVPTFQRSSCLLILHKLLLPATQRLLTNLILPTRFRKRFDATDHFQYHLRFKLRRELTP